VYTLPGREVASELLRDAKEPALILLLDAEGLTGLVEAKDRNAFLERLHTEAVVAPSGH
jgi:hypothetical protein